MVDLENTFTAVDVFSGCGGLTLGLKQAGFSVLAAVELEPKAAKVFAINHPSTHLLCEDVRFIKGARLLKDIGLSLGQLDLLAGCPPCQGFSRIRCRNKGLAKDKRNLLIDEFARLVLEMRPKCIMMENVAALANYTRFKTFLRLLRRHGYFYNLATLDTADFGVPQTRKRLILVGSSVETPSLAKPLSRRATVHDAIGSLLPPGHGSDELHDVPDKRSERVKEIMAAVVPDGGSRRDLPEHLKLICHKNSDGFADVYGRMAWHKPAPTITSGCNNPSKGRFIHPDQHRAITLREAAILQGFPPSYHFDVRLGKEAIALMIGNALPPPFVEMHARALKKSIQQKSYEHEAVRQERFDL